ncbi:hypothetical protein PCANC_08148 [Puccinia coronata f. sp. avenae]|uniref:[histone H3]-trimethyl-L-lysine(9) demethylase n=1 Tax=Puccinia coronata f. sp. avenae TaxID=200324 RepID=A0A2N5VLY2_9BASI|nr:hypothetical protein PCANC_08148 [Puccinia coronata f. sp. avenae]
MADGHEKTEEPIPLPLGLELALAQSGNPGEPMPSEAPAKEEELPASHSQTQTQSQGHALHQEQQLPTEHQHSPQGQPTREAQQEEPRETLAEAPRDTQHEEPEKESQLEPAQGKTKQETGPSDLLLSLTLASEDASQLKPSVPQQQQDDQPPQEPAQAWQDQTEQIVPHHSTEQIRHHQTEQESPLQPQLVAELPPQVAEPQPQVAEPQPEQKPVSIAQLAPNLSESHFIADLQPIPSSDLPPIVTCQSESMNSQFNSRTSRHSTPESLRSSATSLNDDEGSGPDYYTSESESESESELSPKQRAKRDKLKTERDAIKPSYYYGEKELEEEAINKGAKPPKVKRKGLRGVPVFEPSMEQFRDFYSYINQIDRWGMRSGIVKIIPPKEWSEQLPHLGQESLRTDGEGQMLRNAKIKSPISQVIQGSRGLFRVMNVAKRKTYNALEWYDLANSKEHCPPDFLNKTVNSSSVNCNQDHPETSNTRSTRSSRRSASSIAPISHKIANPRRRKVSKGDSVADTFMADPTSPVKQDSPVKRDAEETVDCSPSKLLPVPEDQSQPCQDSAENNPAGPLNLTSTSDQLLSHCTPSKPATAAPDDQNCPAKIDEINPSCTAETDRQPDEPSNPEETQNSDAADQSQDMQNAQTTSNQCTPVSIDNPSTKDKRTWRRPIQNVPTPEEWAQFIERYEKLPYDASKSDYSFQVCREIEQEYWRTIGNGGEPMYGADTMGSLFDERTKDWNVANLDNLLNRLKLKKKIPGVNTPYLYFGTWRATFAWHVEDADLYSINYIHFGAPKFWYSIPQEHNPRFESFMSSSFAKERRTCSQFLRHKAFLASPSVLKSVGIQLHKVVHLPGEIIITYPYGYHSGFNLGYNCAESVNFANDAWIEKGKKAQSCKCIDDAVTINVEAWLAEHHALCRKEVDSQERAAQKLRRVQKHEERKRQRSDNLDGPLPKRKKKEKKATEDSGEKVDPGLNSLLDPSLVNVSSQPAKAPKRGRPKKKPETDLGGNIIPKKPSELSDKTLKRKSSGSGPGTSKKTNSVVPRKFPCMLCPDPSEEGLVRIIEEPSHVPSGPLHTTTPADSPPTTTNVLNPGQDVSLTDGKLVPEPSKAVQPVKHQSSRLKPVKWAHKVCCMFTPSTWFERLPNGEEVVKGFEAIEKARWALKCQLCKEKMGTKVQCTKSEKCAKACHVTCGLKSGLFFLDAKIVKGDLSYSLLDPSPDGVPPGLDVGQDPTLVVLCKQHNPTYQKAEAERKAKALADKVAQFVPGQTLKVRTSQGVFQVFFHTRDEASKTLRVSFEDGHSAVLPYNKVYFGSAETSAKKLEASTQNNQQSSAQAQQGCSSALLMQPPPNLVPTMAGQMMPTGVQPLLEGCQPREQACDADSPQLALLDLLSHEGSSINPCLSFPPNIHPALQSDLPPSAATHCHEISHSATPFKPLSAIEAGLIDSRLL